MDLDRLYFSFALPFVSYILRYLFYNFARGNRPDLYGEAIGPFESAKYFRYLGWDMASASMGIYLIALIARDSHFSALQQGTGEFINVFAVVVTVIFVIFYGAAVVLRFTIMETAEKVRKHRKRWGLLSWAIGLSLLFSTASLAVRA